MKMSYYADKVTIVVRENYQFKGHPPSNEVVAKLTFDGFINQSAIEKLLAFLGEEVYPFDPVSFKTSIIGTNE